MTGRLCWCWNGGVSGLETEPPEETACHVCWWLGSQRNTLPAIVPASAPFAHRDVTSSSALCHPALPYKKNRRQPTKSRLTVPVFPR